MVFKYFIKKLMYLLFKLIYKIKFIIKEKVCKNLLIYYKYVNKLKVILKKL